MNAKSAGRSSKDDRKRPSPVKLKRSQGLPCGLLYAVDTIVSGVCSIQASSEKQRWSKLKGNRLTRLKGSGPHHRSNGRAQSRLDGVPNPSNSYSHSIDHELNSNCRHSGINDTKPKKNKEVHRLIEVNDVFRENTNGENENDSNQKAFTSKD